MNKKNITKMLVVLNIFILASCIQSKGNAPSITSSGDNSTDTDTNTGTTPTAACGSGGVCRIFMTSATFANGNFGANSTAALAAADNYCSTDAYKPTTGTYKALLANADRAPGSNWVLYANQTYVRKNGTTEIGTTTSGSIFSGTLTNSVVDIATDASWITGIEIDSGTGAWSGANTNQNCNNFTTNSTTKYFGYGLPSTSAENSFGYPATGSLMVHCNLVNQSNVSSDNPHILCVEQ